jgi:hypothetical protein
MGLLADLVRMTVSGTPGTGTITLLAADLGCRTFAQAGVPDGSLVSYGVIDGISREVGVGVYNATAGTLTRGLRASSTGSLLNLTSAALVYITPNADDLAIIGDGAIWGFLASNTAGFTTTRVSLSVGGCLDSTNQVVIRTAAPITKRLDAVWAAGTNNGGRDSATALANGETWHLFVILNPTTRAVDALWSKSPTAPTLPSGFTFFRRVFSIMLEAASTSIRQFVHYGDYTELKVRSTDLVAATNAVATGTLRTIAVPAGIKVQARLFYSATSSTGTPSGSVVFSGVFDPDVGVPTFGVSTQWAQMRITFNDSNTRYQSIVLECWTSAAQQVFTASTDTNEVITMGVIGWSDPRGRLYG